MPLILLIFFFLGNPPLQAQNEAAIQSIRKHFYATNGSLETFEKVDIGDNITAYCKDGNIYKIIKKRGKKDFIELYYNGGKDSLYFIFTVQNDLENRYYFHKKLLIRWLDADKNKVVPANQGWKKLHKDHKGYLQIYDEVFDVYLKKILGLKKTNMEIEDTGFADLLEEAIVEFSSDIQVFQKEEKLEIPKALKKTFTQSVNYQKIKEHYDALLIEESEQKIELERNFNPADNLKYYVFSKTDASPIHVLTTSGGHPCGALMYYEYWAMFIEKNGQMELLETPRINDIFQIGDSKMLYLHSLKEELIIQKLLSNGELETILQETAYSSGCGC